MTRQTGWVIDRSRDEIAGMRAFEGMWRRFCKPSERYKVWMRETS
ncbi:MAG: hypothetical protein ABI681_14355 [Gemmatimonadales bacterium]